MNQTNKSIYVGDYLIYPILAVKRNIDFPDVKQSREKVKGLMNFSGVPTVNPLEVICDANGKHVMVFRGDFPETAQTMAGQRGLVIDQNGYLKPNVKNLGDVLGFYDL